MIDGNSLEKVLTEHASVAVGLGLVGARSSGGECAIALRSELEGTDIVFRDLSGEHVHGLLNDLGAGVRISGENPDVLDVENTTETHACVDDGVAIVVGLKDLVVAGGHERNKLDLEVAVVVFGVDDEGLAGTTTPLALAVIVVVVADADRTVVVECIGGSIANAGLVGAVLVSLVFVPRAQVGIEIEVLLDLGLLALSEDV